MYTPFIIKFTIQKFMKLLVLPWTLHLSTLLLDSFPFISDLIRKRD